MSQQQYKAHFSYSENCQDTSYVERFGSGYMSPPETSPSHSLPKTRKSSLHTKKRVAFEDIDQLLFRNFKDEDCKDIDYQPTQKNSQYQTNLKITKPTRRSRRNKTPKAKNRTILEFFSIKNSDDLELNKLDREHLPVKATFEPQTPSRKLAKLIVKTPDRPTVVEVPSSSPFVTPLKGIDKQTELLQSPTLSKSKSKPQLSSAPKAASILCSQWEEEEEDRMIEKKAYITPKGDMICENLSDTDVEDYDYEYNKSTSQSLHASSQQWSLVDTELSPPRSQYISEYTQKFQSGQDPNQRINSSPTRAAPGESLLEKWAQTRQRINHLMGSSCDEFDDSEFQEPQNNIPDLTQNQLSLSNSSTRILSPKVSFIGIDEIDGFPATQIQVTQNTEDSQAPVTTLEESEQLEHVIGGFVIPGTQNSQRSIPIKQGNTRVLKKASLCETIGSESEKSVTKEKANLSHYISTKSSPNQPADFPPTQYSISNSNIATQSDAINTQYYMDKLLTNSVMESLPLPDFSVEINRE